ncbi:MAG: hypothetical protein ACYTFT_15660 [Planctomycetota bacterium]|jgi:hypothetical protein
MNDWRSRAWYQIQALTRILGPEDPEVKRRGRMFSAIDTFVPQQHREPQFAQLELFTRTQAEMLGLMIQAPGVKDHVLPPEEEKPAIAKEASAPAAAKPTSEASPHPAAKDSDPKEPTVEPASKPEDAAHPKPASKFAPLNTGPPIDPETETKRPAFSFKPLKSNKKKKRENPAKLYKKATACWNLYQVNEGNATTEGRAKAREALRELKELVIKLGSNPDGRGQIEALEKVVGVSEKDIVRGELEKRLA